MERRVLVCSEVSNLSRMNRMSLEKALIFSRFMGVAVDGVCIAEWIY
jgi:hypothetical protein